MNPSPPPVRRTSMSRLAEQAFSRAAGAPLSAGNAVELLIDGEANFSAWHAAIAHARHYILFENYIFRDDDTGRGFVQALAARAAAGVRVCVLRDWLGCLGQSTLRMWQPLLAAGGEVRTYNPPSLASPFGWLSRDHRKLLVVDGEVAFLGGVCVSGKWLADAANDVPAWRDTGVAVRGPSLPDFVQAFADVWEQLGTPLPPAIVGADAPAPCGDVDLRVIATVPNTAGLYRLDQFIAGMARKNLWIADAYFVGVSPYVQALVAAARDGVDVRLLVPGTSDIPAVGSLSRGGYRPLLEAGVRVYEWNGSMMHAKTAVADGRWARVGSTNLNVASWLGNCEIDIAIEDERFAHRMQEQYLADLAESTEIVLHMSRRAHREARHKTEVDVSQPARTKPDAPLGTRGSAGRAAAGALRIANSVGAAITNRRVLGHSETRSLALAGGMLLLIAALAALWPWLIAWPLAALLTWIGGALVFRSLKAKPGPGRDS